MTNEKNLQTTRLYLKMILTIYRNLIIILKEKEKRNCNKKEIYDGYQQEN